MTRSPFEELLSRLADKGCEVRRKGPQKADANCPVCDDRGHHLGVGEATGGKVLVHCFHGCSPEAVVNALGLKLSDLFTGSPNGSGWREGITLADYAQAKRLNISTLTAAGVREGTGKHGRTQLIFPHRDAAGRLVPRYRDQLTGDHQFRWPKGMEVKSRGLLFVGADFVERAKEAGLAFAVEGESDRLTLDQHGFVSFGVPGAEMLNADRIARLLAGVPRLYIVNERDKGAAAFLRGFAAVDGVADRAWALDLAPWNVKDPNELHCLDPERFRDRMEAAMAAAVPLAEAMAKAVSPVEPAQSGRFALTDLGNAERLVAAHGAHLRYNVTSGQWLVWSGRVWAVDETGEVNRLTAETVRGILREAADMPDLEQQAALAKHALKSESAPRLEATANLARWRPGVAVRATDLDRDTYLLNVRNGLLDLRTGRLRPHDPAALCAKLAPVEYDARAVCPRWERFLAEVFAQDSDLPAYLRRVAGYLLTGATHEQECYFLVGKGANGKGVMLDTLAAVVGDYWRDTPFSTFLETRESATNDLAGLVGARLVTASEGSGRDSFNEALLKRVTGEDPITCRFLYRDYFSYLPRFRVVFSTNEVPRFTSQAYAIRRRVRIVRFRQTFYAPEEGREPVRDDGLREALRAELPGVLAWAVRGCLDWQREGMFTPSCVREASQDLFASMDPLGDFLGECCALGPTLEVSTGELWRAYQEYCERERRAPVFKRQDSFTRSVGQRDGVEWKHRNRGGFLIGVGLRLDSGM